MPRAARSTVSLPRLVLFDMDDTIFDHTLTCRAAIAQLRTVRPFLRRRKLPDLLDDYQRLLGETHSEVAVGRRSAGDARAERWRKIASTCGTILDATEASAVSAEYRTIYQSLRRPVDGAPGTLRQLHKRAKIGIVTNNEVTEQEEKVRFLGIEESVDLLVVSGEVGVTKPDPRIFRTALDRAAVGPGDAVMIGDSWQNDVLGALGAGIRPVWFNRFHLRRPDPIPVPEIPSLRSVRSVERAIGSRAAAVEGRTAEPSARAL
jgi:pyrimidine 5'-nucleotidase